MDYEKKYNSALERARNYYKGLAPCRAKDELELIFPELRESEDERIRKALVWHLKADVDFVSNGVTKAECIAYLEKQKEQKPISQEDFDTAKHEALWEEQKPAEYNAFKKWVEDYWSHNKVNNPYSYNKGDEVQFDHKGFVSFCEAYCYPQNLVLHDTFGYEEGRQTGQNEGVKLVLDNPEKYGLQKEQKPAEWSEEDEKNCNRIIRFLEPHKTIFPTKETKEEMQNWLKNRLKSLRPQYHGDVTMTEAYKMGLEAGKASSWKPSEEQIYSLGAVVKGVGEANVGSIGYNLKDLYEQLKKL